MNVNSMFKAAVMLNGKKIIDLAREVGLSQPALSNLLNGRHKNPTLDTLQRLCIYLPIKIEVKYTGPVELDKQAKKACLMSKKDYLKYRFESAPKHLVLGEVDNPTQLGKKFLDTYSREHKQAVAIGILKGLEVAEENLSLYNL